MLFFLILPRYVQPPLVPQQQQPRRQQRQQRHRLPQPLPLYHHQPKSQKVRLKTVSVMYILSYIYYITLRIKKLPSVSFCLCLLIIRARRGRQYPLIVVKVD